WVFGREYTDHTLKDILALPVSRSSIVISKIIVVIAWSILLSAVFLVFSVLFGRMAGLSQWSTGYFAAFLYKYTMVTLLSILLCTPVAFFTCYSRGLLLPVGIIILTMIMANFSGLVGLGPYFPWSIPGLFGVYSTASGEHLNLVSYVILVMTSLAGFGGTLAWWQYADHK
ncbi:MAG TPA: ABC transporter permease, partial [Bacteroidales bacterium]|nr:ABC transporter permease [Bacteroidales bacterium]